MPQARQPSVLMDLIIRRQVEAILPKESHPFFTVGESVNVGDYELSFFAQTTQTMIWAIC